MVCILLFRKRSLYGKVFQFAMKQFYAFFIRFDSLLIHWSISGVFWAKWHDKKQNSSKIQKSNIYPAFDQV